MLSKRDDLASVSGMLTALDGVHTLGAACLDVDVVCGGSGCASLIGGLRASSPRKMGITLESMNT